MRSSAQFLLILALAVCSSPALAKTDAKAQVTATVQPQTVELGSVFRYEVTASTSGAQALDVLGGPEFGSEIQLLGQRRAPTFMSINGAVKRQLKITYTFRALKDGRLKIGSPKIRSGSTMLAAKPVTVRVVAKGSVKRTQAKSDTGSKKYIIESQLEPSGRIYVGQQLTLAYTLYVDARVMGLNGGAPKQPDLDDFWIEELTERDTGRQQTISKGGRLMHLRPIRSFALFPLKAGAAIIEPMEISLQTQRSFFRKGTEHNIRTEKTTLDVLPLPSDAPSGFHEGNVGEWELDVRVDTSATRVGAPVTVYVTVRGEGQSSRLRLPKLPEIQGIRTGEPLETSKKSIRSGRVRGEKTLTYTLTPIEPGRIELPELKFVYFIPKKEAYSVSKSRPIRLEVAPGTLPPDPIERSALTQRATSSTEDLVEGIINLLPDPRPVSPSLDSPLSVAQTWWFWLLLVLTVLANLALLSEAPVRARRAQTRPERERRRRADALLNELKVAADADSTAQTIRAFLKEICGLTPGQVSSGRIQTSLVDLGLSTTAADIIASIIKDADDARFAPVNSSGKGRGEEAYEILESLRPSPRSSRAAGVAAASIILLAFMPANASSPSPITAYRSGDFAVAAEGYTELAEASPDNADLWFNTAIARARNQEFPKARLAIAKAALRAPSDSDIALVSSHLLRVVRLQSIEADRRSVALEGDETLFWWKVSAGVPRNVPPIALLICLSTLAGVLLVRRRSDAESSLRVGLRWAAIVAIVASLVAAGVWLARAQVLARITPVIVTSDAPDYREGPSKHSASVRRPKGALPGVMLQQLESRDKWVKVSVGAGHVWLPKTDVQAID